MEVSKYLHQANDNLLNCVPTQCPHCSSELHVINDLHLTCVNENCIGKKYHQFLENFGRLGVVGASGATAKKLWNIGFRSPFTVFNPEIFNEDFLILSDEFKKGRSLELLINAVKDVKSIKLETVILSMGISEIGSSTSKMLAKYYCGQDYDFAGLTKVAIEEFKQRQTEVDSIIRDLTTWGIEIIYPEEIKKDSIKFEMTGSPKNFGFKTKSEFVSHAKNKGYVHSKISDADVLVVDDLNSSSSKMKTAQKKGLKVLLYSEI